MKKFTEVFGFILAIIIAYSSIAKAQHYPFGGVGLTLGLSILLFPFLILFAIQYYQEHKTIVPMIFVGFSTLLYLTGFLFLIQHWPGGNFLLFAGLVFLLITLVVLEIVELAKRPENRKYSVITISFIIMAASLLYAASFRSVGHGVLNGLISGNEDLMKSTTMVHAQFSSKYDQYYASHPSISKLYMELKEKSNALVDMIEIIKKKLAAKANGSSDFTDYATVRGLDNVDVTNIVMIEGGIAAQLKNRINDYLEYISATDSVFQTSGYLKNILNTMDPPVPEGEHTTWESAKFLNVPVICAISNLSGIQLNIRTCEMVLLQHLE